MRLRDAQNLAKRSSEQGVRFGVERNPDKPNAYCVAAYTTRGRKVSEDWGGQVGIIIDRAQFRGEQFEQEVQSTAPRPAAPPARKRGGNSAGPKTRRKTTMTYDPKMTLELSDGTPVTFVKTTSKGNTQVRVPDNHPLGREDPLRIFRPDGSHYKSLTTLTLRNTADAKPTGAGDSTSGAASAAPTPDAPFSVSTVGGELNITLRLGGFVLSFSATQG